MKITIKNNTLFMILELLEKFSGKRRQARALARFIRLVREKVQELEEERMTIFKNFCLLDKNGELELTDSNQVKWIEGKKERGIQEVNQLLCDESIIDLTEFENYYEDLRMLLENEEVRLDSEQSQIYDTLLDCLETGETSC